jgi:hypothetical protein
LSIINKMASALIPLALTAAPTVLKTASHVLRKVPFIDKIFKFFGAGLRKMSIQSIIFKANYGWTPKKAKAWLKRHNIHPIKRVHITKKLRNMRYRLIDPKKFRIFKSKSIPKYGITLVFGKRSSGGFKRKPIKLRKIAKRGLYHKGERTALKYYGKRPHELIPRNAIVKRVVKFEEPTREEKMPTRSYY